mgnify:CR=1 FL=1
MEKRRTKENYYLDIAQTVAERSTCLRKRYGAIIVKNDHIVSTGYNGAARGEPNCCDTGKCYRQEHNIPHGERYEFCSAVHAECNAIINASPEEMNGATLYLAGFEDRKQIDNPKPCVMCERMIRNAGIKEVICSDESTSLGKHPVVIYGYSDDTVVIENGSYKDDEIGCYNSDVVLDFTDGTRISIQYGIALGRANKDLDGIWKIFVLKEGTAPHELKTCSGTNDKDYSDVFKIRADVIRHSVISK